MERRIIDKRKKEKFMMDDEYLNGQARLCGWQGTIVYNSLCRHADINQESFPSIKLMAEQHRVGSPTIIKGIKNLEKRKIIQVKKTRTKNGQWLNNTYILLDKSEWDYSQVLVEDTASHVTVDDMDHVTVDTPPCNRGLHDHVTVGYTKETHKQGNTFKETHLSSKTDVLQEGAKEKLYAIDSLSIPYGRTPNNSNSNSNNTTPKVVAEESSIGKQVGEIMSLFKKISPALKYNDTTQRKACQEMIEFCGFGKAKEACEVIISVQGETYAPRASTPFIAWKKFGDFKSFIDQKKSNKPKVAFIS